MPSQPIIFANIPEVKNFTCKFVYNFFQPDESVNDTIKVDPTVSKIDSKLSRYISFDFISPELITKSNESGKPQIAQLPNISDHLDKIYFENELTTNNFISIKLQDEGIDDKLYLLTSSSIAYNIENYNKGLQNSFQAEESQLNNAHSLCASS